MLSMTPIRPKAPRKPRPTLQVEQAAVAKPAALQPQAPAQPPSAPREAAPKAPAAPTAAPAPVSAAPKPVADAAGTPMVKGSAAPSGTATGFANIGVTGSGTDRAERYGDQQRAVGTTFGPGGNVGGFRPTGERLSGVDTSNVDAAADLARGAAPVVEEVNARPEAPMSNDEFDAQVRRMLSDLLSGKGMNVDTAEEEALIKQLMQDQIGQGLVEQRARMGRAGFGASGALAAMEGDVQRQAAQRATQETLATRRQAEQDAIERALNAVGIDVTKRREGREAAFDEEFLNALKSALGMEVLPEEPPDAAGAAANAVLDAANASILNQGVETETPSLPSAGAGAQPGYESPGTAGNPIPVSSPPPGSQRQGETDAGEPLYWSEETRRYYVVRG